MLHNGVMPLPERLGRLQRVSRLGSGGFATVWLYRDETLDSLVAVKALAENWAQRADVSDRFLEEARVLRRADSDHVVRVYDIGENDERPYFVMSYADQGTVGDLVERAPLPPQEVADIVWQAAQGLDVLHRMGIVHRDVKPQNLLLQTGASGETRLVVADLGVAKALAFSSGLTLVVGTPEYMAPEQVDPAGGVDARADIHALAAVAYHLLTGSPVRSGGLESVMNPSSPGPPSLFVPNVSRELDHVLARALATDRKRRHPDVLAFASEFGQATYSRPGDPRRAGAGTAWPGAAALGAQTQVGLPVVGAMSDPTPTAMQPGPGAAPSTPVTPQPTYVSPGPPPDREAATAVAVEPAGGSDCSSWSWLCSWWRPSVATGWRPGTTTRIRPRAPAPARRTRRQLPDRRAPSRSRCLHPGPRPSGRDRPSPTASPTRISSHGCRRRRRSRLRRPWRSRSSTGSARRPATG